MARTDTLGNFLTDVADSIRTKTGSQATIQASAFDTQIDNLDVEDWSDVGYSSKPQSIDLMHDIAQEILEDWDPDNPHDFTTGGTQYTTYKRGINILPLIDTSNVSDFYRFFQYNTGLTEVPAIIVSNSVTRIQEMFSYCSSLKKVNTSNFDTSKVTKMRGMFYNCSNLKSVDLSSFDTSKVTEMNNMFSGCSLLETINFGNNFTFESATNLNNMFSSCAKLDNNTLNQILYLCTTIGNDYTDTKTLVKLGINPGTITDIKERIPTLSNYQSFLDAGWTTGWTEE